MRQFYLAAFIVIAVIDAWQINIIRDLLGTLKQQDALIGELLTKDHDLRLVSYASEDTPGTCTIQYGHHDDVLMWRTRDGSCRTEDVEQIIRMVRASSSRPITPGVDAAGMRITRAH